MATGVTQINLNDLSNYKSKLIAEATAISGAWAQFNAAFAGILNNGMIDGKTKISLTKSVAKASKEAAQVILSFDNLKDYINKSVEAGVKADDEKAAQDFQKTLDQFGY